MTLVGSVHFVDRVDPWWDPSTFWTCDPGWVRPLCGLISLTLGGIRPLCGLVSSTLVRSVRFVDRVDLGGIRPLCGHVSLTLVGSVHFVDLYVWPLVGSVHFVVIILVVRTQYGLECSFIRFKAVEKSTYPRGLN